MSVAHIGQVAWNKDIPMSNSVKNKISKSKTGQKHSEETKIKMSKARKGKPQPNYGFCKVSEHIQEEMCNKFSLGNINIKNLSNEYGYNISLIRRILKKKNLLKCQKK